MYCTCCTKLLRLLPGREVWCSNSLNAQTEATWRCPEDCVARRSVHWRKGGGRGFDRHRQDDQPSTTVLARSRAGN